MGNTLVVIADLGAFRCYKMDNTELLGTPRLELIEEMNPREMDHRYANTLTARTGRSAQGNVNLQSSGNNSDGESHNMELEKRRRALKQIGERLNHLLAGADYERCFLAAPEEINTQLLEALTPVVRKKIDKNLGCDLTRLNKSEMLEHFMSHTSNQAH
jgi:Protein required for attachment to host cells